MRLATGLALVLLATGTLAACDGEGGDDHDSSFGDAVSSTDEGSPGDYDGTCYDCATVCVNCDAAYTATCTSECERVQGYSDGFMWLESQASGHWGCDGDHATWSSVACP